uniref:Maternal effect embryo arrest 60 protein n=1 Tax=Dimocarpus longan TaxID=128017 RepID=M1S189_9ROSI|nr:maternal effect embryo arrest 60 protein [Dimocarpus longan]
MTTSIHITALDGVVNVNSLFTFAVFVGLAWNPRDPNNSLISDQTCTPDPRVMEDMISFHIYSFSSFLFSSLVALGLKQAIRLSRNSWTGGGGGGDHDSIAATFLGHVNKGLVRVGMLVSGVGSVMGCVFLMLALINVVQIKLGTLSCESGSGHSFAAVVPLVILVPVALLSYVSVVLYAFIRS